MCLNTPSSGKNGDKEFTWLKSFETADPTKTKYTRPTTLSSNLLLNYRSKWLTKKMLNRTN